MPISAASARNCHHDAKPFPATFTEQRLDTLANGFWLDWNSTTTILLPPKDTTIPTTHTGHGQRRSCPREDTTLIRLSEELCDPPIAVKQTRCKGKKTLKNTDQGAVANGQPAEALGARWHNFVW